MVHVEEKKKNTQEIRRKLAKKYCSLDNTYLYFQILLCMHNSEETNLPIMVIMVKKKKKFAINAMLCMPL